MEIQRLGWVLSRSWLATALLLALSWGCDDAATGDSADAALRDDASQSDGGGGGGGGAGGEGGGDGRLCAVGETRCVDGRLRTCLDEGDGWLVERCEAGEHCVDGACRELACAPGARVCTDGGVAVCAEDGSGPGDPTPCPADTSCYEGVCLGQTCAPGETACGEGVRLTCAADGLAWERAPCAERERCIDGACVIGGSGDCPPGLVLCALDGVVSCGPDGTTWTEQPCADDELCFQGECVRCVRDEDCGPAGACVEGDCADAPLVVMTDALPAGSVGQAYRAEFAAANGTPPYVWSLADGEAPAGLELGANGALTGTPDAAGDHPISVRVTDAEGATAEATLTLRIFPPGLVISTNSPLPNAEEGSAYTVAFEAVGGQAPYGWFVVDGVLPAGLELRADGRLAGTPTEVGAFAFRLRAVDAATPPAFAEADFRLEVTVAPLRIIGDQTLDLFITQIVTLPTMTIIPNIPVPYETRLTARGGLRPHIWSEEPIPDALRQFIPQSGLPEGLTLEEDGRIHGSVVDPELQVQVPIPFTPIVLTGFFFTAQVRDSQGVPATDTAIFLIPTLPIGG